LRLKEKTIDLLVDYMSFFDFRSITSRFDTVKKKGYSFSNLLFILMVMPFLHMGQPSCLACFWHLLSERSGERCLLPPKEQSEYKLEERAVWL